MATLSPMKELMVAIILAEVASGAGGMPVANWQWVGPIGLHGEAEKSTPSIRTVGPKRGAVVIGQHGEVEKQTVVESDAKKSIIRSTRSKKSAVFIGQQDQFERRGVAGLEVSGAVGMPVAEGQPTAPVGLHGEAEKWKPSIRTAGPTRGAIVRSARPKSSTVPIGQHDQFERQGIAELEASGGVGMSVAEEQGTAPVALLHGGAVKSTPSIRTVGPKRAAVAIDVSIDRHGQIDKQTVTESDAKKSIIRFARLKKSVERQRAVGLEAVSRMRSTTTTQLLVIVCFSIFGILAFYCFALACLFQSSVRTTGSEDGTAPGGLLGHADEYGNVCKD